jgi:putative phosphoribosyl transferase
MLNVTQRYIEAEVNTQRREIEDRLLLFRGNKYYELNDKAAILVDDGIATGSTIFAAAKWTINNQKCKELLVAVPVVV